MNYKQLQKFFPYLYVSILLFTVAFVYYALNLDLVEVSQIDKTEKKVKDVKPVKVQFVIEANGSTWTWQKRLENTDTFSNLLEELRRDEEIYYEKTEYIHGTEYHDVNNINKPDGYVWSVYAGDENITYDTEGVFLVDKMVYKMVLEPKQ